MAEFDRDYAGIQSEAQRPCRDPKFRFMHYSDDLTGFFWRIHQSHGEICGSKGVCTGNLGTAPQPRNALHLADARSHSISGAMS